MFSKDKLLSEINKKGWSRYKLSKESGVAQTTLRDIFGEKQVTPSTRTLEKIASTLEVPISSFFDDEEKFLNTNIEDETVFLGSGKLNLQLSKKAEKDIEKSLSQTLDLLQNSQDALMFDGEPIDDLTRELLAESLENSMRMAKKIAKEKYTPNKYKK